MSKATVSVTDTGGLRPGMRVRIDGKETLRITRVGRHEFTVEPLRWWHRVWMWVRRQVHVTW